MSKRTIPYTSDDLRYIADRIDEVSEALGAVASDIPDGHWAWGLTVDIFDDGGDTVGQVKPDGDGWLGFFPYGVTT